MENKKEKRKVGEKKEKKKYISFKKNEKYREEMMRKSEIQKWVMRRIDYKERDKIKGLEFREKFCIQRL